jgi:ABC-2 type transport system ATP-binding protein/lipopolysaccharide transport system ATP-binding protein
MRATIETVGLGKRYRLGEHVRGDLREALLRRGRGAAVARDLWALRDVNVRVGDGEAVGLIGRNGAGKSTLLRIIARITEPTTGVSRTRGRVAALLEVGTGFHAELTGRENIFLNGAILGMSRNDVRRRFTDIVAFAGVERFLDTPLKRYSSGMYLRLAFAVAAHVEPEIVIVDEVLAVGDAEFQQRCLTRISEMGREQRTVIFVSHDLGSVARVCPRVVWLDDGGVRADGPAEQIIASYLGSSLEPGPSTEFAADADKRSQIVACSLVGPDGDLLEAPRRDRPFALRLRFLVREHTPGLDLAVILFNRRGIRVVDDAWSDSRPTSACGEMGEYEALVEIPPVLPAGQYTVAAWIGRGHETIDYREIFPFELFPGLTDGAASVRRNRVVQPPITWAVGVPGHHSGARALESADG